MILSAIMVLKTGPDRPVQPVQPGTSVSPGPVLFKNQKFRKNCSKIGNRRFDRDNRELERLNQLCSGSLISKLYLFFNLNYTLFFFFFIIKKLVTPLSHSLSASQALPLSVSLSHSFLISLTLAISLSP